MPATNNHPLPRVLALCAALASGCRYSVLPTPPLDHPRPRLEIAKEFTVGMLGFGIHRDMLDLRADLTPDRPGTRPPVAATATARTQHDINYVVPATILTELGGVFEPGKPRRFAVVEGGSLGGSEALTETSADRLVDAYINGTITSATDNQVCFEFRLSNAHTHEVIYSSSSCVEVVASRLNREKIRDLAYEMSRKVNKVESAKILNIDDKFVTIDKGFNAGVVRGMVAYIREVGLAESNPEVHAAILEVMIGDDAKQQGPAEKPSAKAAGNDQVVVGELYILSVDAETSIGVLYRGNYARLDDEVRFK